MVLYEIQLMMMDLVSKVQASAHSTCNGYACLKAWLLAHLAQLIDCA
jgi:hypothetical protein